LKNTVEVFRIPIRRHYEMLAVASLVVVLSLILQVRSDDRVIVTGFPDYPLPHACLSYAWFGIRCPGCGLTRSLVHLAHGDWAASWHDHRVGWLMALAIFLQFPYRLIALWRGGPPPLGIWVPRIFGYALITLLIGNWAVGLLWK
jgi:hypothetical protein